MDQNPNDTFHSATPDWDVQPDNQVFTQTNTQPDDAKWILNFVGRLYDAQGNALALGTLIMPGVFLTSRHAVNELKLNELSVRFSWGAETKIFFFEGVLEDGSLLGNPTDYLVLLIRGLTPLCWNQFLSTMEPPDRFWCPSLESDFLYNDAKNYMLWQYLSSYQDIFPTLEGYVGSPYICLVENQPKIFGLHGSIAGGKRSCISFVAIFCNNPQNYLKIIFNCHYQQSLNYLSIISLQTPQKFTSFSTIDLDKRDEEYGQKSHLFGDVAVPSLNSFIGTQILLRYWMKGKANYIDTEGKQFDLTNNNDCLYFLCAGYRDWRGGLSNNDKIERNKIYKLYLSLRLSLNISVNCRDINTIIANNAHLSLTQEDKGFLRKLFDALRNIKQWKVLVQKENINGDIDWQMINLGSAAPNGESVFDMGYKLGLTQYWMQGANYHIQDRIKKLEYLHNKWERLSSAQKAHYNKKLGNPATAEERKYAFTTKIHNKEKQLKIRYQGYNTAGFDADGAMRAYKLPYAKERREALTQKHANYHFQLKSLNRSDDANEGFQYSAPPGYEWKKDTNGSPRLVKKSY